MASNEKNNKNRPKENNADSDNDEEQLPNQLSLVNSQSSSVEAVVKDISDSVKSCLGPVPQSERLLRE